MAIDSNIERVSYGGPSGSIITGQHREVFAAVGATRTLKADESGALCLFDTAAGCVWTLPAPVQGMFFDFNVIITLTGTGTVRTNAATVYLNGGVQIGSETLLESADSFAANGTSHVSLVMDADTKGRIKGGGTVRFTAISSTVWAVSGFLVGAGTLATPFV
jgi:hypothetical protein